MWTSDFPRWRVDLSLDPSLIFYQGLSEANEVEM